MSRKPKNNFDEIQYQKGDHALDLKKLAHQSIESYFKDKFWFVGGPIPFKELFSDNSLKTVIRTPFDDETFDFIHEECLTKISQPPSYKEKSVPWSVTFLIQLLNEMKALGLPKDFQPGLLLLYFKFCVGVTIPLPPMI